jgi:hypothetical protein
MGLRMLKRVAKVGENAPCTASTMVDIIQKYLPVFLYVFLDFHTTS